MFLNRSNKQSADERGCNVLKGYYTSNGYMGYVNGVYILFADSTEYEEYMSDED